MVRHLAERYIYICYIQKTLHYTPHYTTLQTTLHNKLHYTTHYTTLQTTLHNKLHYTTLQTTHYTTNYTTLHYTTLNTTLHSVQTASYTLACVYDTPHGKCTYLRITVSIIARDNTCMEIIPIATTRSVTDIYIYTYIQQILQDSYRVSYLEG